MELDAQFLRRVLLDLGDVLGELSDPKRGRGNPDQSAIGRFFVAVELALEVLVPCLMAVLLATDPRALSDLRQPVPHVLVLVAVALRLVLGDGHRQRLKQQPRQ